MLAMQVDAAQKRKSGPDDRLTDGGGGGEAKATEAGYRELVRLLAQLGLSNARQVRVVKSIAITTVTLDRQVKVHGQEKTMLKVAKEASQKYHREVKGMKQEREQMGVVHCHVFARLMQFLAD
eukprot:TRINITY_DN75245_c0_g1_i1.p3 TRINITY_DN75245_c0_g1~~TRINITY_DN75245_c0_g1_i1.p3  ORF type:complete len:123 (-),score=37.47 TRINITY_DN75245_c0_g1_i1:796-1164(-)